MNFQLKITTLKILKLFAIKNIYKEPTKKERIILTTETCTGK